MRKTLQRTAIAAMAAVVLGGGAATAQKTDYAFHKSDTPKELSRYFTTVYMIDGKRVTDMAGGVFCEQGKPLVGLAVSPAGLNYVVLTAEKKGNVARLFDASEADSELEKFSVKKYGTPASAVYVPSARQILIATDRGVQMFDAKRRNLLETIELDFVPTKMVMSGDGYYLVCADDHRVSVYNFEERKERKTWKYDEKVNAVAFDKDNSMLGVLTDDGLLTVYDARSFGLKHSVDELGEGLDFDFNFDGKYVAVAVAPEKILVVNLLKDSDRQEIEVPAGGLSELLFIQDSNQYTLLASNATNALNVKRMNGMTPFYGKLIADGVADRMNEWLKMMPGESMDDYRARVNDETRARQQRLFEDEISTQLAGDPLAMSEVTLGKYDRNNQMLEVDFDNMPSILIPVPESDLQMISGAGDLEFHEAKYGIMPNDNFELIYAIVRHKDTGKEWVYDNLDRKPLMFLESDDNIVSIEMIQQQQMEEMKLQELKEQVVAEAKQDNVISDHTNISVDSRVEPGYDANGKKILNYKISFTYEVEPGFSVHEDFGPGKYQIDESGAASSMLRIVKEAFEGDFAQYLAQGKKVLVKISGTADASPIIRGIPYNGVYGDFDNEIVWQNGQMTGISVNSKELIKQNEQLAFLRAYGVKDYLSKNVGRFNDMNANYEYHIGVAEGKGSEFRRITTEFTFVDVF